MLWVVTFSVFDPSLTSSAVVWAIPGAAQNTKRTASSQTCFMVAPLRVRGHSAFAEATADRRSPGGGWSSQVSIVEAESISERESGSGATLLRFLERLRPMRKIDVFTHIFPEAYVAGMRRVAPGLKDAGKRVRGIPMLVD